MHDCADAYADADSDAQARYAGYARQLQEHSWPRRRRDNPHWDAVAGATGYEVQQKKVKTAWPDEWKPLPFDSFTVDIRGTQAVVGGLQNDKSYHHRVRGVSADGRSEWTPELTTDLAELLKPRGLVGSVKQSSIGEITLQWSAVSVATRYEVQQKVVRALWFDDWQTLPFQNVSITIAGSQAVIGNLRYGATYEHQVRSVNAAGPSGWSASVKTDDCLRCQPGATSRTTP